MDLKSIPYIAFGNLVENIFYRSMLMGIENDKESWKILNRIASGKKVS